MQQALGWLGWSPDQFWGSTLYELHTGVVGYVEAQRAISGAKDEPEPLTSAENDELLEMGRKAVRDENRKAKIDERK